MEGASEKRMLGAAGRRTLESSPSFTEDAFVLLTRSWTHRGRGGGTAHCSPASEESCLGMRTEQHLHGSPRRVLTLRGTEDILNSEIKLVTNHYIT